MADLTLLATARRRLAGRRPSRRLSVAAVLLAGLLASSVAVHAQAQDPAALVAAHEAGVNAGDVDAATAPFADDAVVQTPRRAFVGKDQIRGWVQGIVRGRISYELVGERQVVGDRVTWTRNNYSDDIRDLGVAPLRGSGEAVVQGGKIRTFSFTLSPEAAARERAAQAVLAVRDDFDAAVNAGDIDALMALWADDAVRVAPTGARQVGKEQIRRAWEGLIAQHNRSEPVRHQVAGDRIVSVQNVSSDAFAALGIASVQNESEFLVRGGKIVFGRVSRTPASVTTQTNAQNKALASRIYQEAFNGRNLDLLDEIASADFVDHSPDPGQAPDLAGVKESILAFFAAFPDAWFTADLMVAEGDTVASRLTVTGTHLGAFGGIPPTGAQVTITGVDIVRIAGGRVVERWGNFDELALLTQLGVIPPLS